MKHKNTDDLQQELTATPDLRRFLCANQEHFIHENFAEMLLELFNKSNLSKSALSKQAGTSEVYLYQIFSGERTPSRDRTLCLCIGMGASLQETQELLKRSGLAQLYVKNRRDAIIIYGIANQMNLMEINDQLFTENEPTLC